MPDARGGALRLRAVPVRFVFFGWYRRGLKTNPGGPIVSGPVMTSQNPGKTGKWNQVITRKSRAGLGGVLRSGGLMG